MRRRNEEKEVGGTGMRAGRRKMDKGRRRCQKMRAEDYGGRESSGEGP